MDRGKTERLLAAEAGVVRHIYAKAHHGMVGLRKSYDIGTKTNTRWLQGLSVLTARALREVKNEEITRTKAAVNTVFANPDSYDSAIAALEGALRKSGKKPS